MARFALRRMLELWFENMQRMASHLAFKVNSEKPAHLITREFESGTFSLKIDGKPAGSVSVNGGAGKLNVPMGAHTVELGK